jgi:PAS domain S-box-containing protein
VTVTSPLRILLLEDDPGDADLIREFLDADRLPCGLTRVDTRAGFLGALEDLAINLILADYKLPSFDGISALKLALGARPELPFIFVSGTLGEEVAVEALKIGATDYVLKSGLTRLVPAIQRALREAGERAERRKAEAALRRSERELRDVIETIPAMVFCTAPDGTNLWVNQRWIRYTGLSGQETSGSGWKTTLHPDDSEEYVAKLQHALTTGEPFENEVRHRRGDGEYRWFLVRAEPLRDEQGKIVNWYGNATDIEDRRRAEEALRESEQRFRDYAEIASDWLWESGPDHRFTRVSRLPGSWGVTAQFRGLKRWDLAADREEEAEKWRDHIETLDMHQPFRGFRYKMTRPDGAAAYVSVSAKPMFDADLTFLGYRGVTSDITAEVRADQAERALREAQDELAHITRVTTLGELAASIAHEISQPLAAIATDAGTGLRWLDRDVPNLPEVRESFEHIVKAARHAGDVLGRIRTLSRKAPSRKEALDVNEAIREVTTLTRAEMVRNRVELRTELDADLPAVQADKTELQQVLINLIVNAIEAMSDGDRRDLLIASTRHDANHVRLSVCDSGPGVDPAAADRIFQAFYTTKPAGLGMGLAICKSIIDGFGGQLFARSNAPCGTIFEFTLPV